MDNRPKKGRGFIYKYTGPSGKSYIGQTVQSLRDRAGHKGKLYAGCPHFYPAIKKYGFENFSVEVLGEYPVDQLNSKERYFIEVFNTLYPNGYNASPGGEVIPRESRPIYQYSVEDGRLLRGWKSTTEAAKELGLKTSISLNQCLLGYIKTSMGYCWSYNLLEKYPVKERISNEEKQIYMYDVNTNKLIKAFSSIGQAAAFVNGERSAIKKCCRGELKFAYGYKWSCKEILVEKKYNNTATKVEQLDKDTGKIIHTFSSISEASRAMGAKGTSLIRRALLNPQLNAYGFKWRRAQGSTTTYQ